MWAYITRRVLYSIPILICVNLITFFLFFFVNTPDDVAHSVLGRKYGDPTTVYRWKREHQYHLPMFLNLQDTILYVTDSKEAPAGLRKALSGYEIREVALGKSALLDGATKSPTVEETERYRNALRKKVANLKKDFAGNEIVIVEWPNIDMPEGRILTSFLETGVPFIVLHRGENPVPEALNISAASPYRLSTGAQLETDREQLRQYIDARQAEGVAALTETLFYKKSVRLFWFQFGKSDRQNIDISREVVTRMGPSLMITVPAFILGLGVNIFIAMIVAYCRGTYVDRMMAVFCIVIMSILSLFYYFSSQLVFGAWLKIAPVSGYLHGFKAIRFVLLPIAVSVFIGIGGGVRFYRTIFLEETNREYVRTARAKGLTQAVVLFKHVLKNALIPILTNVVLVIPMLFVGSLILESFFAIPGLGRFTLEGIQAQDFRIVGSMVYLGSFLYIVGLILTDISYTLVDPRVRLE